LAGLIDERNDNRRHAQDLGGEAGKAVEPFLGWRLQETRVMECGEPLGAR
jgi:hypothetical protein